MIIDSVDKLLQAIRRTSTRQILASDTVVESAQVPMIGKLKAPQQSGKYATLEVPQEFADRIYDAIYEDGMEKPEHGSHISVMTDDELDSLQKPLPEDGQKFEFMLGGIESCDPENWDEMEKVWFVKCDAPQLEKLRQKYGLTPLMFNDHNFHITIAVKPKKEESEMKFSSKQEALQYLSDLVQKRVVIAAEESWKNEIVHFLVDNPTPSDDKIHSWADEHNIEHDKIEEEIYTLAHKYAKFKLQGKSVKESINEQKIDPEELRMGIEIEKEHINDDDVAKRISLDHLAEIPDYYTRLKAMEDEAKVEGDGERA